MGRKICDTVERRERLSDAGYRGGFDSAGLGRGGETDSVPAEVVDRVELAEEDVCVKKGKVSGRSSKMPKSNRRHGHGGRKQFRKVTEGCVSLPPTMNKEPI